MWNKHGGFREREGSEVVVKGRKLKWAGIEPVRAWEAMQMNLDLSGALSPFKLGSNAIQFTC